MPGYAKAEADRLSRQLGLVVKIEGFQHLRPGVVRYEGIELADPETGRTILRSRSLEVGWHGPSFRVIASQPEVESAAVGPAWAWVQRLLESRPGRFDGDLQFSAAEVMLRAADCSQSLSDVAGAMETLARKTIVRVNFRLAGDRSSEPAEIRVVRNRDVSPPAGGFELSTGDGELPCGVLAMGLAELKTLGGRCRFHGRIWANETPDGWQGEIAGQLAELDIGGIIADHFPYRLSGIGTLTIDSARFRCGRLEEGSGILIAGPGTVDRPLVSAAVDRLRLTPGADLLAIASVPEWIDGEPIGYERLALAMVLDAHGLQLRGLCPAAPRGTILADAHNPLLGQPTRGPQPVTALVQTLVPQSSVQVPASRESDWLLHHLPVPPVVPLSRNEATARLRSDDTLRR